MNCALYSFVDFKVGCEYCQTNYCLFEDETILSEVWMVVVSLVNVVAW